MKFNKVINEVVDMTKQKTSNNWNDARRLWNNLVSRGEVYPTDHMGFISFERFFKSYIEENGKEPTVQDAIREFLTNIPKYRGRE